MAAAMEPRAPPRRVVVAAGEEGEETARAVAAGFFLFLAATPACFLEIFTASRVSSVSDRPVSSVPSPEREGDSSDSCMSLVCH